MKKEYYYSVPASAQISQPIRKIAEDIFKKTPMSVKIINRLKLVFSEIFMNAITHGSDKNGIIDIHITIENDNVKVAISDRGKKAKPITAKEIKKIINFNEQHNTLTKTSGRGLALITKKCTDNFEIQENKNGGITITFVKKFNINDMEQKNKTSIEPKKTCILSYEKRKVFQLSGEIEEINLADKTEEIEKYLNNNSLKQQSIVIDAIDLKFFISVFIGKLAEWNQLIEKNYGSMEIINASESIYDILDIVGMTKMIKVSKKK